MATEPGPIPDKPYFKIGEAAQLVGVKPSVLRFWETEFRTLRPEKTRSNQRLYTRKSIEKLRRIRELLYDRGFTIAGARRALREPPTADELAAAEAAERAAAERAAAERELTAAAAEAARREVIGAAAADHEATRTRIASAQSAIDRAKKELRELLQLCDE
jgi:DNA-binding transcriptional MerR regulator